jgi:hypothetical protein
MSVLTLSAFNAFLGKSHKAASGISLYAVRVAPSK